jgi:hypothetical protein
MTDTALDGDASASRRANDWQLNHLMGVIQGQLTLFPMATGTSLRKERDGGRRVQPYLRMTGMTRFAARLPSLGGWHPSLAFCRRRICGRWPAGIGGVLLQPRFKSFQALEESEYYKLYP